MGYIAESGIRNGHVLIQSKHTTTGILLNENEAGLLEDIIKHLTQQVPEDKEYQHDDLSKRDCPPDEPLNGHSHLKAAHYTITSLALVLHDSELQAGKYQRIFFAEFDGPCPRKHKSVRKYLVSIIGE
jgi:secondary thiamine-phosphate synthase enzyme